MWRLPDIADAINEALESHEHALFREQAVYGLDSLTELDLHPIIASGLQSLHCGVVREQPYPHEWRTRKTAPAPEAPTTAGATDGPTLVHVGSTDEFPARPASDAPLPHHRDRLRCDLVLTPHPGDVLGDPVKHERAKRDHTRELRGTLFESLHPPVPEPDIRKPLAPEDAFWLEVKAVAQFDLSSGAPGFNRTYASALTRSLATDLRKLSDDARIISGAALLVLFTLDRETSDHDIPIALHRCLDRGLEVAAPEIRRFPILDRLGNALCTTCLVAIKREPHLMPGLTALPPE